MNTDGIILEVGIFLALNQTLKEIDYFKNKVLGENKEKYKKFNALRKHSKIMREQYQKKLKWSLIVILIKIYEEFKKKIKENAVQKNPKRTSYFNNKKMSQNFS